MLRGSHPRQGYIDMINLRLPLSLAITGILAGCSSEPVSVQQATALCMEPARKAGGPTGSFGFGVDSESGLQTRISIELTDDYLAGRDPDEVFEECVIKRSGSKPEQSYSDLVGNG